MERRHPGAQEVCGAEDSASILDVWARLRALISHRSSGWQLHFILLLLEVSARQRCNQIENSSLVCKLGNC